MYIEFKISNGYKAEEEERTNYGRQYRRLKIVTSKANVIEVKRYIDNGGKPQDSWKGLILIRTKIDTLSLFFPSRI